MIDHMARTRAIFRQQDVTRALRGTVAAGVSVTKIEFYGDGKIVIVTNASEPSEQPEVESVTHSIVL